MKKILMLCILISLIALSHCGNVVIGNGNRVKGDKNIINHSDRNDVHGNSNDIAYGYQNRVIGDMNQLFKTYNLQVQGNLHKFSGN